MKVLVWQDHGQVTVLSGSLHAIVGKTLVTMAFSYSEEDIKYVSSYTSEFDFEIRVRNITVDDECFEIFEFVNVEEI